MQRIPVLRRRDVKMPLKGFVIDIMAGETVFAAHGVNLLIKQAQHKRTGGQPPLTTVRRQLLPGHLFENTLQVPFGIARFLNEIIDGEWRMDIPFQPVQQLVNNFLFEGRFHDELRSLVSVSK